MRLSNFDIIITIKITALNNDNLEIIDIVDVLDAIFPQNSEDPC